MKFYLPFSTTHHRDKIWESWYKVSIKILTFAEFCQFSPDPICMLWSEWDVPVNLILVTRNYRGRKMISLLPL